jgi:hypothetical protein
LAFDAGTVGAIADQIFRVTVTGRAVLIDARIAFAGISAAAFYVPQQLTFVADSAQTTVTFQDKSVTYVGIDALLDNVRVTAESDSAPRITVSPARTAVPEGQQAVFTVLASGPTTAVRYQWQFNGNDIPDAIESTFTVNGANSSHAGNYRVVVSNDAGAVYSSTATLTVLPASILLNGSFEYGSAAWMFTGTNVSTSTNAAYGVTDGRELAHFNWGQAKPNGAISQTVRTVPGHEYVLTFDAGAFSLVNHDEQRMQVTVQGQSTLLSRSISVVANGKGGTYLPQTFTFSADSESTTVTFKDVSTVTKNVDLLLDNVRLTDTYSEKSRHVSTN